MKFMIAGLGSIGRRHLRNLVALGEQDILLFRTHQSTLPEEDLAGFPVETDLRAALNWKPDAVIISNPTALHLDVAIPSAEAGCSILMEKPISDTLARMDELKFAMEKGGGKMLVGFHFRHHPTLQQARRLLAAGELGKPLSFFVQWAEFLPGWHPYEDYRQSYAARADLGGGVVRTLCHPLDYLRWMVGEVKALWAFTGKLSDMEIDVEDTAEIGLRFENGMVGTLHLDYNRRPGVHRWEITGSKGTMEWNNTSGALRLFREEIESWESFLVPEGFERNDLFIAEMRHFLEVVQGKTEPVCTLEDGIRAQELVDAVFTSADRFMIVR